MFCMKIFSVLNSHCLIWNVTNPENGTLMHFIYMYVLDSFLFITELVNIFNIFQFLFS